MGRGEMEALLGTEIAGIRMRNPVLVCSGTWGNGREYAEWMDPGGLGGIITKSVTLRPCAGNPPPRLWETPCGMLNSIGLENPGLEVFLERDLPWLAGMGVPVWVNVAGFSEEEYAKVAGEVCAAGLAAALELNISCPNVRKRGMHFSASAEDAARLVSRVKERCDLPLFVKLSPRTADMKGMCAAVARAGADGLSLVNTLPAMAIDIEKGVPGLGNATGGLSGPAIHPVAVLAVWEAFASVDIPIIGMGGIWGWEDAVELIMAGASAVAVGTLNFVDPWAPLAVAEGIADFLSRKGIAGVAGLVGVAHRGGFGAQADGGGAGSQERTERHGKGEMI
ncbi:MAG: dihydroorotate dehydrogenase [Actinomycetota bacterium]|nr:dihydroorotate dehydrogenase [Actinomycetota bacterium]